MTNSNESTYNPNRKKSAIEEEMWKTFVDNKLYLEVEELITKGMYDNALLTCRKALQNPEKHPDLTPRQALVAAAKCYNRMGLKNHSIDCLLEAEKIPIENIYKEITVEEEMSKIFSLNEYHDNANIHIATAVQLMQNLAKDQNHLEGMVADFAKSYAILSAEQMKKDRFDNSLKFSTISVKLGLSINQPNVIHLVGLADSYKGLGLDDRAEELYRDILKMPGSQFAHEGLVDISIYRENFEEAIVNSLYLIDKCTKEILKTEDVFMKKEMLPAYKGAGIKLLIKSFKMNEKKGASPQATLLESFEILKQKELYEQTGILVAAFLQYMGDGVKASAISKEIVNIINHDPSISREAPGSFFSIGKSRNTVKTTHIHTYVNENFGGIDYIIKIGSTLDEKLKAEYITQLFLATHIDHFNKSHELTGIIEVEQPICYLEQDKKGILVQKRLSEITLKEYIGQPLEKIELEIQKTIDSAVKISALSTPHIKKADNKYIISIADSQSNTYETEVPSFNYVENLQRRFLNRLSISEEEKNKFIQEYLRVIDVSKNESLKYFLHGDLNACNVLLGGQIIDFEMKTMGNPMHDFTHLTTNTDFTNINKEELLIRYFDKLDEFKISAKDLETIMSTYNQNVLHNQICKIGSNINQGDYERARIYKENAITTLENMRETRFIDTLNQVTKGKV